MAGAPGFESPSMHSGLKRCAPGAHGARVLTGRRGIHGARQLRAAETISSKVPKSSSSRHGRSEDSVRCGDLLWSTHLQLITNRAVDAPSRPLPDHGTRLVHGKQDLRKYLGRWKGPLS